MEIILSSDDAYKVAKSISFVTDMVGVFNVKLDIINVRIKTYKDESNNSTVNIWFEYNDNGNTINIKKFIALDSMININRSISNVHSDVNPKIYYH